MPVPETSPRSVWRPDASAQADGPFTRHLHPADLRGAAQLATEATLETTRLVEAVHAAVLTSLRPGSADPPPRTTGLTGFIYRTVRRIAGIAGVGSGRLMAALEKAFAPMPRPDTDVRDRVLSVLNGILGDHLSASGNPLARSFSLRTPDGRPVDPDAMENAAPDTLVVFVHGLCLSDRDWIPATRDRTGHVEAITTAVDGTAVLARYNSGRALSANGQALATHLKRLTTSADEGARVVIVTHSMGGLVARSALRHARRTSASWLDLVTETIYLGTPHRGAPLERAGTWIETQLRRTPVTAPFADLADRRSRGIQDLRCGIDALNDGPPSDPADRDHTASSSSRALYVAGAMVPSPPTGRVVGDGLVPVSSALDLPEPGCAANRRVVEQCGHFDLLHDPAVTEQLLRWLSATSAA